MSNQTIGPGNMDVCRECTSNPKREIEHQIADELEKHPEILNGNALLHDLLRLRRGQRGYESELKCGED